MKTRMLSGVVAVLGVLGLGARARAAVVYSQPHDGTGGWHQSSWWDPDGSDYDQLTWDSFRLTKPTAITEVHWRGGFDPTHFGMGGPVVDFTVAVYGDIANGYQPDVTHAPLVEYQTGGNAGQAAAGAFGSMVMFDYAFTLPSPFPVTADRAYWVLIEAWQHGIPDWGLAQGAGGNGTCFRRTAGVGDIRFYIGPGETAFALLDASPPGWLIAASAFPLAGGSVSGDGSFPTGALVSLGATPNPGFSFVNWTEGSVPLSTAPAYAFNAVADRTLVAHFAPRLGVRLAAPGAVAVSWPASADGYVLQQNRDLGGAGWAVVTDAASVVGSERQVQLALVANDVFYRLFHP